MADRACRSLFAPSPGLSPPVCKGHDADFEQAAGYVDQRPPRKAASHASGASSFCVQRAIIDYRTVVESCRKLGRRIVVNAETIAALPESRGLLTGWFGLLAS